MEPVAEPTAGSVVPSGSAPAAGPALLTLDELTARVGLSVRTVRFYTTRGLVPPPIRRGRCGYYAAEHVARLELVQELQSHGFTLSAIERYLEGIPAEVTPEDLALRRAMLAPWQVDRPVDLTRAGLDARCGRTLSADELATLAALGIVSPVGSDSFEVAVAQLSVGLALLDLGVPEEAARAASEVYAAHGRAIAEELHHLFRTRIWPAYRSSGASPAKLQEVVERLKPLSISALVSAYEAAMDDTRRAEVARLAGAAEPQQTPG